MLNRNKRNTVKKVIAGVIGLSALTWGITACSKGNTDGGQTGQDNFSGTQYVSGNGSAGSIRIALASSDHLGVSKVEGFYVKVRDASGSGVSGMGVSCDTEQGLSLIEPSSGSETTDASGQISGKIGCSAPGSYLMECRLPVGTNLRTSTTVVCEGPTPTGFGGFPGPVGGGGLGGGASNNGDGGLGGSNSSGVRITNILAYDAGDTTTATTSIDIVQDSCKNSSGTITPEPFFDTILGVTAINNSNSIIRFSTYKYTLGDPDGSGATFTSNTLPLTGEAASLDKNGGKDTFFILTFNADSGGKRAYGAADLIQTNGFKPVSVTLFGTNALGEAVSVTSSITLSFSDFDRCAKAS